MIKPAEIACPGPEVTYRRLTVSSAESDFDSIDVHLDQCVSCQKYLEEKCSIGSSRADDLSQTLTGPTAEAMHRDGIGRLPHFDDFILLRRIGGGGQGAVYEAAQRSTRGQRKALKLVAPAAGAGSSREALAREIDGLKSLDHPGVVRFFGSARAKSGEIAIVMEFIDGVSGHQLDRVDGIDSHDRVRLAAGLAESLAHAHSRGVVHHDVKPRNVLIVGTGEDARTKLVDFGLARGRASKFGRTLPGGTPRYWSPEQAGESDEAIDHRSDLFSLGVTLATWLGPEDRKALADSQCRQLDRVIEQLTQKSPDQRYASATTVASDLRAILDWQPTTFQVERLTDRTQLCLRRNRRALLVGGAVVAGMSSLALLWRSAEYERRNERGSIARRMLDRVNPLTSDNPDRYSSEQSAVVAEAAAAELAALDDRSDDVLLSHRMTTANLLMNVGKHAKAEEVLTGLIEDCENRFGNHNDDTITVRLILANALMAQGRLDQAEAIYDSAATVWNARYGPADARLATIDLYRAKLSAVRGDHTRVIELCNGILHRHGQTTSTIDMLVPETYVRRGQSHLVLQDASAAADDFRQALRGYEATTLSSDHVRLRKIRSWISETENEAMSARE